MKVDKAVELLKMINSGRYEEISYVRDYMKENNLPYKKQECVEYLTELLNKK